MNLKELNQELNEFCEKWLSAEAKEELICLLNETYEQGFRSGYSECKIVNFID